MAYFLISLRVVGWGNTTITSPKCQKHLLIWNRESLHPYISPLFSVKSNVFYSVHLACIAFVIIKIHIIHANGAAYGPQHRRLICTFVTDRCAILTRESLNQLQFQFTLGFHILLTADKTFFFNNGCIYVAIPIEFRRNLNWNSGIQKVPNK